MSLSAGLHQLLDTPPTEAGRTGLETASCDIQSECRQRLADFFQIADPRDLILTSGATESLNLALHGLNLRGKHVISTASEHNSVLRPLKTLETRGEISLSWAASDAQGRVIPDSIPELLRANTALVVLNHCSNVTGNSNDLKAVSQICREAGVLLLLDASQSAGLLPLDLSQTPVDLMAFTGHKSLYGLRGTGGLYLRPDLDLEPLKQGGQVFKVNGS